MTRRPDSLAFHQIDCSSGDELFEHLRLSHSAWRGASYGDFAFRGQADATWTLTPKALRPGTQFGYRRPLQNGPLARITDQCHAEWGALDEYLELVNTIGLPLPNGAGVLYSIDALRELAHESVTRNTWPDTRLWELLAVAQHHGIPTRLLDFSLHPFVAGFFAARDSAASATASHFAIWAIDLRFVERSINLAPNRERVRIVRVPRAGNAYLHAQHGFFLLDTGINSAWCGQPVSLHDTIDASVADALRRNGFWTPPYTQDVVLPAVTKITCPREYAIGLLRMLHAEGVTQAHLMPDLSGVASALDLIRTLGASRT